jgi:hypothetical protein
VVEDCGDVLVVVDREYAAGVSFAIAEEGAFDGDDIGGAIVPA